MNVLILILAALAALSLVLVVWQLLVALRFPLHRPTPASGFAPGISILKPLKGCDPETAACLQSWLEQDYSGPVEILFGVAKADDPVVPVVHLLLERFPKVKARMIICLESHGANAKVSTLIQLAREAHHGIVLVSDADVRVPKDFLVGVTAPFKEASTGLVTCFYRLANASTLAMRWEAVAINADFWSLVLQSQSLQPLDFALGAVMAVRREHLEKMGGFLSLADYLADDYQLGHQVAAQGARIVLCPTVVDLWEGPQTWGQVFRHQVRWARTVRVCRPVPYFFSILNNATLWPLLFMLASRQFWAVGLGCLVIAVRTLIGLYLQYRLTRSKAHVWYDFMVPLNDLLHTVVWALAFAGHTIEWRGIHYHVERSGKLTPR